ncbi:MAG: GlcNAc transferase [Fuerstiella sp.]|nr:GlcNAc transferase [Fuerstiella sp.]
MIHREAAELVELNGGRAVQSMSGSVSMLVVGEEGWPLEEDGAASQKLTHATQLMADGAEIRIVAESDWLHLINLIERREEIHRSYTPAMLQTLLGVPGNVIRRWARIQLIRPVSIVGRCPYFDYREVASAQRLARLLDEGVTPECLEKSLSELSRTLAGTDRSLAQLNLLVQDKNVLMRDAHGVLIPGSGQRLLDFDTAADLSLHCSDDPAEPAAADQEREETPNLTPEDEQLTTISFIEARLQLDDRSMSEWTADEWFNEGCRLSEEAAFDSAVNAFRNCLSLLASEHALLRESQTSFSGQAGPVFPDPADVNFHMADALYRAGKTEAAIERYHCATEFAPDFIEAWTQLGCLQTERQQWQLAEEALITAISIHDGNPDALLHYAQLLDQVQRSADAVVYWEKYLRHDSRGPWADHARGRLEEAAQVASEAIDR